MPIDPNDFTLICDLVLKRAGIVLEKGKEYLVDARISMLARKLGFDSISALMVKVKSRDEQTERSVMDAMTTNETSFFRDMHPFETLKKVVIPQLLTQRAAERKLSIWCAASSTGQEPYTIAMLLKDNFPCLASWDVTFIATDLSRDVLQKAKSGRYSQLEVNRGLPATLMVKYFKKVGLEWEIIPTVREMIDFREMNLLGPWPMLPPLDIVFIRNVLIYFNQETKVQILGRIRRLLKPDGYLFLGAAETTLNLDDQFARLPADKSGCYSLRSRIPASAAA